MSRLQTRMMWVAAAVAAPQLVGLMLWDRFSLDHAAEFGLHGMLDRTLDEPGAAARCDADPAGWADRGDRGGEPRPDHHHRPRPPPDHGPPTVHVFAADGRSLTGAPDVDPAAVSAATARVALAGSRDMWLARRTGWPGRCAIVAVRGRHRPPKLGGVPPAIMGLLPALLVATVMGLSVGPPLRRLRALTDAVRNGVVPAPVSGDDEIGELALAYDHAHGALRREADARRQREEALRDFVADTAHDVRIPLTVLRGHLADLEQTAAGPELSAAMAEAHYIGALLDELTAVARLEDPRLDSDVDLVEVVRRVVARHRPIARRLDVSLEHGAPERARARGDLTLVEQMLSNLVYNAVRHNRPGGHVAVSLDVADGQFLVEVIDDGPGVPAHELARLVEAGFRGSAARERGTPGEGRGLAIAHRVATAHGWSLSFDAGDDGGLVVCVRGPSAP